LEKRENIAAASLLFSLVHNAGHSMGHALSYMMEEGVEFSVVGGLEVGVLVAEVDIEDVLLAKLLLRHGVNLDNFRELDALWRL